MTAANPLALAPPLALVPVARQCTLADMSKSRSQGSGHQTHALDEALDDTISEPQRERDTPFVVVDQRSMRG